MKIRLTLLLLVSISTLLLGQKESEKAERIRKKNKISEKLAYKIDLNTNDSILLYQSFYNENGKRIKFLRFNKRSNISSSRLAEYNAKNQIIKEKCYNGLGEIESILIFKYDSNGNNTDYIQHNPDGTIVHLQKYMYNKKNLKTELHFNLKNGNGYYLSTKYSYNKDGQYSKCKLFDYRKGKFFNIRKFKYDKKGNKHKIFDIDKIKNRNKVLSNQYEYDDRNNRISDYRIQSNKKIVYIYDDENNLVEEKTFEKGVLTICILHMPPSAGKHNINSTLALITYD